MGVRESRELVVGDMVDIFIAVKGSPDSCPDEPDGPGENKLFLSVRLYSCFSNAINQSINQVLSWHENLDIKYEENDMLHLHF